MDPSAAFGDDLDTWIIWMQSYLFHLVIPRKTTHRKVWWAQRDRYREINGPLTLLAPGNGAEYHVPTSTFDWVELMMPALKASGEFG